MKNKRGIVIAHKDRPSNRHHKNSIWINIKDKNVTDCIKAAIRMKPDELIIKEDCLYELSMALQKENSTKRIFENKMKAKKIIITEKEIDIDINIKDITLLSIAEYKKYKDIIPLVDCCWWLRSPGSYSDLAAYVSNDGFVFDFGYTVDYDLNAVRPALVYESSNLQIGDKIKIIGCDWTVISDSIILCDDIVGQTCFREDWKANDSNDYEKSDIKRWLHNWWKERAKNEK